MSDPTPPPKIVRFIIRCPKCRWAEMTSGISTDLVHLHEVQNSCSSCGKPRAFKCPTCGATAQMKRVKGL